MVKQDYANFRTENMWPTNMVTKHKSVKRDPGDTQNSEISLSLHYRNKEQYSVTGNGNRSNLTTAGYFCQSGSKNGSIMTQTKEAVGTYILWVYQN